MGRRITGLYVTLAAADAVLAVTGPERLRWLTKPALMPVLMLGRERASRRALALGGVGDVALLGRGEPAFQVGLGAFLAGHVAWVEALRRRPGTGLVRRHPSLAVPYLVLAAALNAYLWRRTGPQRIPVLVYSAGLLATALTALDTGSARAAAGGALFLTSDTLLALERFAGVHVPAHEAVVMTTYAGAQALLAADRAPLASVPARPRAAT